MRIVCLGGGAAGLYFSILMKKADPAADITVIERNQPDSTFGWGIVFSDKTMDGFRADDPQVVGRPEDFEITVRERRMGGHGSRKAGFRPPSRAAKLAESVVRF